MYLFFSEVIWFQWVVVRIVGRALLPSILLLWLGLAHAQDIAVVGSMTGSLAGAGDQVKRGAELAAKDINEAGVQSLHGQSAARDAKARKAKVKIALLAQYSSKTCSTIDLSPVPTPGVGHGRAWRQSLIRDLIEPVQSDETKSALGSHVQEFAFSGDVPGFRII